jgi:hypothetical protein
MSKSIAGTDTNASPQGQDRVAQTRCTPRFRPGADPARRGADPIGVAAPHRRWSAPDVAAAPPCLMLRLLASAPVVTAGPDSRRQAARRCRLAYGRARGQERDERRIVLSPSYQDRDHSLRRTVLSDLFSAAQRRENCGAEASSVANPVANGEILQLFQ